VLQLEHICLGPANIERRVQSRHIIQAFNKNNLIFSSSIKGMKNINKPNKSGETVTSPYNIRHIKSV